jgi:hypothetical protein
MQCGADGGDLMHNLTTIAALLNHTLNSPYLTFDAP